MSYENFYRIKLCANDVSVLRSLQFQLQLDTIAAAVLQSVLHQVEQQNIEQQEGIIQLQYCQLSFFDQLDEQEGN